MYVHIVTYVSVLYSWPFKCAYIYNVTTYITTVKVNETLRVM